MKINYKFVNIVDKFLLPVVRSVSRIQYAVGKNLHTLYFFSFKVRSKSNIKKIEIYLQVSMVVFFLFL